MNIISSYSNVGEEVFYNSFVCEIDSNTILRFEFSKDKTQEKKCKITMEDKVSGVVDITSNTDSNGIKSLLRTLRIVAIQLEAMEKQ